MRNLLRGIIRRVMTKFEMAKWESERSHNRIIAHAGIRHLDPPSGGQTDVWPVQVCEKRAVSARFPAEEIDETSKRVRLGHIERGRRSSGRQCPGSCLSFIESEHAAHFVVDLQLPKVGRICGPSHIPSSGRNEIAFMRAVPKLGAELDRDDPTKSENKVGSRKRPRGDRTL